MVSRKVNNSFIVANQTEQVYDSYQSNSIPSFLRPPVVPLSPGIKKVKIKIKI